MADGGDDPFAGRGPGGRRAGAAVPHGHGKTTTPVVGLRLSGPTVPTVVDGSLFRACIEQQPAPTPSRGDVVVMDNLAWHEVAGVSGVAVSPQSRRVRVFARPS